MSAFDTLCSVRMGIRESLLAFNSLWTGIVIVTSHVYSVFVLTYYRSNFRTNLLIVQTHPPPFHEKSLINVYHRIRMPEMKLYFVRIIRLTMVGLFIGNCGSLIVYVCQLLLSSKILAFLLVHICRVNPELICLNMAS